MITTLRDTFSKNFNVVITPKLVADFHKNVLQYENVPLHAGVLGSPLLGINKMYFLPQNVQSLFDIFNIDFRDFRKAVIDSPSVNPSFNVISDPYNVLTSWLVFLTLSSKSLSIKVKHQLALDLLKMLHYKFFTSIVNHNLQHGANEGVMQYTIDNLSNKFAIKSAGTWKNLIEQRCVNIVSSRSPHHKTFQTYTPDDKVLYIISDAQTGVRKQIVGVTRQYYLNKEAGKGIDAMAMVENINGDTSLRAITSSLDIMVANVTNSVTNLAEFIDHEYVDIVVRLTNDITTDTFIRFLTKVSILAEHQHKDGTSQVVSGSKAEPSYEGYAILIKTTLQKTYGLCMRDKEVDMNSKVSILKKVINIYRSSRTSNEDVIAIKRSIALLINKYSDSNRESTNSSLRIAFILYLIMLSFKSIH